MKIAYYYVVHFDLSKVSQDREIVNYCQFAKGTFRAPFVTLSSNIVSEPTKHEMDGHFPAFSQSSHARLSLCD